MSFCKKNILERINDIEKEDLEYIESDLSFYQLVSITFLLYGDITSARELVLQKLVILCQYPPEGKGFRKMQNQLIRSHNILSNYVKLNPNKWRQYLIEALAIIRANRMLRKLGLSWQEVYQHFLPSVAEISVNVHPLLKALYKISERLTPDQAGRLIEYVNTRHTDCRHLRFYDTLYLEVFLLNWLTKNVIVIGNSCNIQILIEYCKLNDMDCFKDILLETINQHYRKEPSPGLQNLTLSDNNLHFNDSGISMSPLAKASESCDKKTAILNGFDAAERYKIKKESAGYILIINQSTFYKEDDPDLKHLVPEGFNFKRNGSDIDCEKLNEVFSSFGYTPLVCNNLTHLQILEQIRETVKRSLLKDSLIICILSHGMEGAVYGCNFIPVAISDIKEILTADTLTGKPKMIFIQACQKYDPKIDTTSTKVIQKFLPDAYADILLFTSSIRGTESLRDPNRGSWFIQSICDFVQKHGNSKHMLDILPIVINHISKKGSTARDEVMLPEFSTTLRKELSLPR